MKKILMMAVAGIFAFVAAETSAVAATIDLGTLGAPGSASDTSLVGAGAYGDSWTFHLDANSDLSGSVSDIALPGLLDIANFSVRLFQVSPLGAIGSTLLDPAGNGLVFSYTNLGPGDYFFAVFGQATGAGGGLYGLQLNAAVSQVPLPPALLLFLSAIGGIGGVAYRRRQTLPGAA